MLKKLPTLAGAIGIVAVATLTLGHAQTPAEPQVYRPGLGGLAVPGSGFPAGEALR